MRKFIFCLICAFLLAGFPNTGQAFSFLGGGGGHKHRSSGQGMDAGSLFKFDCSQVTIHPKTGEPVSNNCVSDPFEGLINLPDMGSNDSGSNQYEPAPIFDYSDYTNPSGGGGSGYVAQNNAPVPEPATMILLGAGLIGLAGYGRKKFKK